MRSVNLITAACLFLTGGCGAAAAAAGDAEAVPEPDAGIASKYVMDKGIGKDPDVIFHEDFEDEDLRARGWYDLHSWKKHLLITPEDKATGSKCIKIVYPKGTCGPWFRAPHFKHGIETMHVRYYRKWMDGWDWTGKGDGNGHDTRLVANGPQLPKQAYKANDMTVLMMESCTHFNPWRRGLFGLMLYTRRQHITDAIRTKRREEEAQGHKLRGGEWWLATTDRKRSPKSPPGRWFCVEYMGRMNTPGKADGEIKGWIDGKLYYHIKNTMIRDGSAKDATWRRWWVGPYFHGGTNKEQWSYLDGLVIAKRYVGPMVKENSPAPKKPAAETKAPERPVRADGLAAAEKRAGRLFQMARQAERMGQRDVARKLYAQIIEKHPATEVAARARSKLR